jgi:hypothetical protein
MAAQQGKAGGQQGRQGQQGQQGQQQAQAGQQGQQGQGQQGQGQQQGQSQQGQSGQQGGQQAAGGPRGGGSPAFGGSGGPWRNWGDGSNRGWQPYWPGGRGPTPRPLSPEELNQLAREGYADLTEIERSLGRDDPAFTRDLDQLRDELRRIPNSRFGTPIVLTHDQLQLLQVAEQAELLLRRKLDEKQGAQVRAATEQAVPDGYHKAVAEYFRRLSREK